MATRANMPRPEDLINYGEAATLLGTTRRTIERMVRDGRLTKYNLRVRSGRGSMPVRVDRRQVERLKQTVTVAQ